MENYLAENLRILRTKYRYTLEAVSEMIGVSRQSVSKWELGETSPDICNCLKLCTLYKMSLNDLVTLPMKKIEENSFEKTDNRMISITEISENGEIKLPESLMSMFDMSPGNRLMLLADKKQGVAIVKCD